MYLFSFWSEKRFALEKEKVILEGERFVGASHICFQFESVIDILLLLFLEYNPSMHKNQYSTVSLSIFS